MEKLAWTYIELESELMDAIALSVSLPCLFFKHSTRCIVSSMALKSFEKEWVGSDQISLFFIDLISHRSVSSLLASETNVIHQSPQVVVLNNKQVIYHASPHVIDAKLIYETIFPV